MFHKLKIVAFLKTDSMLLTKMIFLYNKVNLVLRYIFNFAEIHFLDLRYLSLLFVCNFKGPGTIAGN